MMTGDSHNPLQQVWDGMGQSDAQTPQTEPNSGAPKFQAFCDVPSHRKALPLPPIIRRISGCTSPFKAT